MSSAVTYLVGQLIGASVIAIFLVAAKKWRWVPAPFILLLVIWAIGYWLATSGQS